MDLWTAIVIIVVVGTLPQILKSWSARNKGQELSEKVADELKTKLASQEERIKNLETVVFELEKERKYSSL